MAQAGDVEGAGDGRDPVAGAVVVAVAQVVDDPGAVSHADHLRDRVAERDVVVEDVLEVAPVGLEAHQPEPQVGGGVADQVVDRDARRARAPRRWPSRAGGR